MQLDQYLPYILAIIAIIILIILYCCCRRDRDGEEPGRVPEVPEDVRQSIRDWWEERQRERGSEGRPPIGLPRPYLKATGDYTQPGCVVPMNTPSKVIATIINYGNAPAWNCHVEISEGPIGYDLPMSNHEIRDRKIISIMPGEQRDVELNWIRRNRTGMLTVICYDPFRDPKDFTTPEQYNRHVTGGAIFDQD